MDVDLAIAAAFGVGGLGGFWALIKQRSADRSAATMAREKLESVKVRKYYDDVVATVARLSDRVDRQDETINDLRDLRRELEADKELLQAANILLSRRNTLLEVEIKQVKLARDALITEVSILQHKVAEILSRSEGLDDLL